jgi:DNA-binding NarL/FixJ family response regulator
MSFKIFIVDDDSAMREMIRDFIATKFDEAEITVYATGESALVELFKKPDVIILDYHLDNTATDAMNGIDILKRIKELLPHVPVIFLSGDEKPEIAANTVKYGAYDYIVKNENAFHRLEIMITNSTGHMTLKKQLNVQRIFNIILLVLLIVVVASFFISRFL